MVLWERVSKYFFEGMDLFSDFHNIRCTKWDGIKTFLLGVHNFYSIVHRETSRSVRAVEPGL